MKQTIINFFIETINRIKTESPEYFIRLRKLAGYLTAIMFVIANIQFIFGGLDIHIHYTTAMLRVISLCDIVYPYLVLAFGFTFLPQKQTNDTTNETPAV